MTTMFMHILHIKAAMILQSINQIRIWNMMEKLNKNTPVSQIFQLQNLLKFSATKKHFTLYTRGPLKSTLGISALSVNWKYLPTRSVGALRVPTSSWRPFGPLDFVLRALRPVRHSCLRSGHFFHAPKFEFVTYQNIALHLVSNAIKNGVNPGLSACAMALHLLQRFSFQF